MNSLSLSESQMKLGEKKGSRPLQYLARVVPLLCPRRAASVTARLTSAEAPCCRGIPSASANRYQ